LFPPMIILKSNEYVLLLDQIFKLLFICHYVISIKHIIIYNTLSNANY